jgi:hypothetical protein
LSPRGTYTINNVNDYRSTKKCQGEPGTHVQDDSKHRSQATENPDITSRTPGLSIRLNNWLSCRQSS